MSWRVSRHSRTTPDRGLLRLFIVLVVELDATSCNLLYAQCLVKRLRDLDHHIALFGYSNDKPHLLLEEPSYESQGILSSPPQSPIVVLQARLRRADAVLVITPNTVHELSFPLSQFEQGDRFFNGHTYSWHSNGVTCVLLGGWINRREVAIELRAIFASSDFPSLSRVLPGPKYLDKVYTVDGNAETPGPCI
ncbi:uncharacterized protein LOC116620377 [Nematostella vectensis]|uniref:uncharacterized protein LOC116620377 n=1 Tax=Nematostella vectensis TaxID=45351 RepID=UPI00138FA4CB|nr:uncharacterized protein LOC116620377 [Nematostella vectensis]